MILPDEEQTDFLESHVLDYIATHYPIQNTVIDVGAHRGNHSIYFANFMSSRMVWAFEPIVADFKILLRNTKFYKNIFPLPCAISDVKAMIRIAENVQVSIYSQRTEAFPLDHLFKNYKTPITLMKLSKAEELRGAKEVLAEWHPLVLLQDTHNEYGILLPGYVVEQSWNEDKTFLYRWNNEES